MLGIKEDTILDAVLDFLGRRIFGPDRLRLLRAEPANATAASWKDHDAELERLQREQRDMQRSLYRRTLRLEEHDDPDHPIVALATRRIEELAARKRPSRRPSPSCAPSGPKAPIPTRSPPYSTRFPTCATRSARSTRTS